MKGVAIFIGHLSWVSSNLNTKKFMNNSYLLCSLTSFTEF
nr:MAG TPA: hypothetical protein [Caudoviricetes sp.]